METAPPESVHRAVNPMVVTMIGPGECTRALFIITNELNKY